MKDKVLEVMERSLVLGRELGMSDEAMENVPTLEQMRAARIRLSQQFGERYIQDGGWTVLGENNFKLGYAQGKMNVEGARRRVAIKRASRAREV